MKKKRAYKPPQVTSEKILSAQLFCTSPGNQFICLDGTCGPTPDC